MYTLTILAASVILPLGMFILPARVLCYLAPKLGLPPMPRREALRVTLTGMLPLFAVPALVFNVVFVYGVSPSDASAMRLLAVFTFLVMSCTMGMMYRFLLQTTFAMALLFSLMQAAIYMGTVALIVMVFFLT